LSLSVGDISNEVCLDGHPSASESSFKSRSDNDCVFFRLTITKNYIHKCKLSDKNDKNSKEKYIIATLLTKIRYAVP